MDETLFAELNKIEPRMKEWFAWLHENAELSGHEVNTAAYVADLLESWGYDVTRNVGENGVVATLRRGSGALPRRIRKPQRNFNPDFPTRRRKLLGRTEDDRRRAVRALPY